MSWKHYFSTSVGKKLVMSLTGIFLVIFLLVHAYVNAQIFWLDGGVKFEEAAHFMGNNPVIRIVEIGLFAFLIWHAVQGLSLTLRNRKKRTVNYHVPIGNKTSKWYSRSMGLLGTLILLFLIMHMYHFWIPNRAAQTFGDGEIDLYQKMDIVFENPLVVILYLLGCISLSFHLLHGFYSAFQTLGLGMTKYKGIIRSVGQAFSIIVPIVFALMPLAYYFNWL